MEELAVRAERAVPVAWEEPAGGEGMEVMASSADVRSATVAGPGAGEVVCLAGLVELADKAEQEETAEQLQCHSPLGARERPPLTLEAVVAGAAALASVVSAETPARLEPEGGEPGQVLAALQA
jgi:hypothetical protein